LVIKICAITQVCVSRSNCRVILTDVKPVAQRVGMRAAFFTSVASLTVGTTLCAVPFKQVEDLCHDSLIRRAASLVTDSSSTLLSQTTLALIEAITLYSKAVHTLVALQRRYLDSVGKLSPADEDAVWHVIIRQRAEVRAEYCVRLNTTWASAVRLCEVAAEAAFSSGAEHACVTIRTHLDLAHGQVEEARKLSTEADKLLIQTKVLEVERLASTQGPEEEEVPEAYLRED
uniref:Direct IAP-binding protein with low pI n=1 Tax=Periophthalmus magnuspinnatus TaxID=409849 RepID=A0A3B4B5C1_9GOBI